MKIQTITALIILSTVGLAFMSFGFMSGEEDFKTFRWIGHSGKPRLGVSVQDVTPELAKEEGIKKEEGAYVRNVMKRSPADSGGIKKGDVILEFNGRKISDAGDLVKAVWKTEVGTRVKTVVEREGETKELFVTLKKFPRRRMSFAFAPRHMSRCIKMFKGPGVFGLRLMPLNPQLGKYFEALDGKGLLVGMVKEGSPAEKAGFTAGDVILKVGDAKVETLREFRSEFAELEEGEKVNVEILRKGSRKSLTLQIEESDEVGSYGYEFDIGDSEATEDIDIEIPELPELEELDIQFDDLHPNLESLQKEIEGLQKRLKEVPLFRTHILV